MTEPRRRSPILSACSGAALLLAGWWLGAAAAAAERLSAEKVSTDIAKRYQVTVLRVTPTKVDDRAAYAVVVMNPGGDDNGAFGVTTLMADAETGELVSQFAHRPAGYDLPSPADRSPPADNGRMIRTLTEREYRER
jgi:hypothetical protein